MKWLLFATCATKKMFPQLKSSTETNSSNYINRRTQTAPASAVEADQLKLILPLWWQIKPPRFPGSRHKAYCMSCKIFMLHSFGSCNLLSANEFKTFSKGILLLSRKVPYCLQCSGVWIHAHTLTLSTQELFAFWIMVLIFLFCLGRLIHFIFFLLHVFFCTSE